MCIRDSAEIDLVFDKLGSQLTFKAPYAKSHTLFKNTSSLEERIRHFLNIEINPHLSMHGGQVNLIEIDQKNSIAIIQFSGGCNGCSMIGITLKETVEKKILASFPEIKKIYDGTEHLHGKHSFYSQYKLFIIKKVSIHHANYFAFRKRLLFLKSFDLIKNVI